MPEKFHKESVVMINSTFELEPSWQRELSDQMKQPYMAALYDFLTQEYAGEIPIYPPKADIFQALWKTPFDHVRVVIIGQDPYHGPDQAHGLCFSVLPNIPPPPSLLNIFKELKTDLGVEMPLHGNLNAWAEQGVLLLNAILTVRQGEPLSHQGQGWEKFTDALVEKLAERTDPPIFVLWGRAAQNKCRPLIEKGIVPSEHFLKAPHPSPLAAHRGFFGSKPFSKINALLSKQGKSSIIW